MPTLRQLLSTQKAQILDVEESQYGILYGNLREARNKLEQELTNDPRLLDNAYRQRLRATLNETLRDFERSQLDYREIYELGADQGTSIVQFSTGHLATPFINYVTISQVSTEVGTGLIQQVSEDLKTIILRGIQTRQALGGNLQDMMADILGSGLQGLRLRNGAFRNARWRSEAIARTTVNDLVNTAALQNYQVIRAETGLDLVKEWVTTSDDRTSPRCSSLSGQIRELEENFVAFDGWEGQKPPSHPFCRSRVIAIKRP